jgi:hypothetical protein
MKLVALRPISTALGTIGTAQTFYADETLGQRLLSHGDAIPEEERDLLPWSGRGYWTVQPEWQGETVVIIGGGPSLTPEQVEYVEHHSWQMIDGFVRHDLRIIAINNVVRIAPWADLLYFCDVRWFNWNRPAVYAYDGYRVTLENLKLQNTIAVRSLRNYGVTGFAPKRDGVTNGRNSGYQAIHLAAWLGVARIILLGFDMRAGKNGKMHWHEEHPVRTPPFIFPRWLECFGELALELRKRNVEVINCTPNSALRVFPYQPLDEVAL